MFTLIVQTTPSPDSWLLLSALTYFILLCLLPWLGRCVPFPLDQLCVPSPFISMIQGLLELKIARFMISSSTVTAWQIDMLDSWFSALQFLGSAAFRLSDNSYVFENVRSLFVSRCFLIFSFFTPNTRQSRSASSRYSSNLQYVVSCFSSAIYSAYSLHDSESCHGNITLSYSDWLGS